MLFQILPKLMIFLNFIYFLLLKIDNYLKLKMILFTQKSNNLLFLKIILHLTTVCFN